MTNSIKILSAENRQKPIWDEYVLKHPEGQLYHLFDWKEIVENTFGHRVSYFAAMENNTTVRGVFPYVHIKSMLFGNYAVSMPYFNYAGPIADDEEIERELVEHAIGEINNANCSHLEMRCTAEKKLDFPVKTSKVTMLLELPENEEDLFKSFPSKLRSQIRRPEKEGMNFVSGREELLDEFYEVFAINMRDLGTPVYTKKLFSNILASFPDTSRLGMVYYNKIPVGAGLVIGFKKTMEIPWASTVRAYNRFSPNMMLYWNLLKLAIEMGYTCFDFGRCTPGEGTHRFKKQWGTSEKQLYWYYWLRNGGDLPEINPDNPKYKLAIGMWRKLPVWLTKIIGPSIVKNLP